MPLKKKWLVNESAVALNEAADHDDDEYSGHEEVSEQRTTVQEAMSSTATDAVSCSYNRGTADHHPQ